MSTKRPYLDYPRNEAGLVDNFIGTAYDVVKGVYDALPELTDLHDQIEQIPNLAVNAVEAAMVPARVEINASIQLSQAWAESLSAPNPNDTSSKSARTWALEAAQHALDANKINRSFPFTFNELQSVYDVTVISGLTDITTAGMSLWIEGAIDYNFVINSTTQFTLTDMASIPQGAAMRLMVNARFDDLAKNLDELQVTFQEDFDEAQASREAEFQEFLENSDYEVPVLYQPGLVISRPSQTVIYDGYSYRVDTLYIPLTTTNWSADSPKMKLIGDKKLRDDLAKPDGADIPAFVRKDYSLNRAIRNVGDYLNVHDIHLQEFADFVVNDDWSYAFDEAFAHGAAFPQPGTGGRLRLGGGAFGLRRQVNIPFGWTLIGTSSDFYGTSLFPLPDFVGDWMCHFGTTTSYNNGRWDSISMDMGNMKGVGCLLFEGAYRNSAVQNCTFRRVGTDVAGLIVRPSTHVGATSVCESTIISDFYVIKDSSEDQTVNGIQLYSLQESVLINVKCFHAGNPAVTRGGSGIYIEDCRGLTIISGGVVGAAYGIHLHAKTRNCTGITIHGMTWENNGSANIKTSGENGFLVTGVDVPTMRTEFPAVPLALDLQGCSGAHFFVGSANVKAAADCNNILVEGSGIGSKDIAVGAQVTFIDRGNAVNRAYRVSPAFDIYSTTNPQFSLSVTGRTGSWRHDWNANATTDSGMRIRSPLGNTLVTFTDAGAGVVSRFQQRTAVQSDNTPAMLWEVTGRASNWRWEWSASISTDNGYRLVGPDGRTVFSARDTGGVSSIGFFDGVRSAKRELTGVITTSDPILKQVVQLLAAYGLATNSTTG